MIRHPALLLAAFVALTAALQRSSGRPALGRIFRLLPVPFWCYFLPMVGAALGLIPHADPLYGFLSRCLLPACLVLLLLGADLPAIARMGPLALAMMLAGSAGTVLGGLAAFFLYKRWLPEGTWGAVGALAGSWIGGSANLLAVKEALRLPDALVGPIILVDAAVAYTWMGLLLWSSGLQNTWDQAVRRPRGSQDACRPQRGRLRSSSDLALASDEAPGRTMPARSSEAMLTPRPPPGLIPVVVLAILISVMARWNILLVTTAALALSMTPLRKLAESGGSGAGTFFLYVLLCSIGARGDLAAVGQAPVFLLLGGTWILIHGAVLLAAGRLCRAPLGLIATASQANIGGPISAPIVGATFSKPLAGVGLLMAILGNVLGTYIGLAVALAARAIGPGG